MRTCTDCARTKPLDEFLPIRGTPYVYGRCRKCRNNLASSSVGHGHRGGRCHHLLGYHLIVVGWPVAARELARNMTRGCFKETSTIPKPGWGQAYASLASDG